ncbi:MAG: peroxiredoxin family protein [Dehalococcoidia bacterium]
MEPGDHVPDLTLEGPDGPVRLADALADGPLVLAFFQEANTPACDAEVRGFASEYDLVRELGGRVLAVSTDPPEAQRRFAEDLSAPFPLLSDPDGAAARAFGVYDEAGRRANRAVFVIGEDGVVRLAIPWYNPQNSAQFEEVFAALGLEPGAGF